VIITLALASSLLSTVAPFSTASSTKLCTMACCAGKAPHVAGSCVHDACETPPLHAQVLERKEHLCGEETASKPAAVAKRKRPIKAPVSPVRSDRVVPSAPQNEVSSFKQPCPPDCGTAICSSTNQRRSRDLITVTLSDHSQASRDRLRLNPYRPATFNEVLSRNCPARAPPSFLT
jgi:hypothetical protein